MKTGISTEQRAMHGRAAQAALLGGDTPKLYLRVRRELGGRIAKVAPEIKEAWKPPHLGNSSRLVLRMFSLVSWSPRSQCTQAQVFMRTFPRPCSGVRVRRARGASFHSIFQRRHKVTNW